MITKLKNAINDLQQFLPNVTVSNTKLSATNIGWHVEHTYLATIKIINAVLHSDATQFTSKFNFIRTIVLFTNNIPRGKGKAPEAVQSIGVSTQELTAMHNKTIEKIDALANADAKQFFPHPYFGNLHKKQAIQFLTIHTNHHIKIIKDILKG
jgi:hypothetical protein